MRGYLGHVESSEVEMKIVIFGCGDIYRKRKSEIPDSVEVVGIIDNNKDLYGRMIDGIAVSAPEEAQRGDYDYIVLMSDAAVEMRDQLIRLGYDGKKLIHYADFLGLFPHKLQTYDGIMKEEKTEKKSLLIVSVFLAFSGVPIVALRTAQTAVQLGYRVTIAADGGDDAYISEAVKSGIDVIICKELKNASLENLLWTDLYDIVLVNSLPMIRLAVKLAQKRRVTVWIHECPDVYECVRFWAEEIIAEIQRETVRLFAVSERAREHFFQRYFVKKDMPILSIGIEDYREHCRELCQLFPKRFLFGLAGGIYFRKGQDIFLSAVEMLPDMVVENSFFLLVGKKITGEFGVNISRRALNINNCILLGERTPQEMYDLYGLLDVVVVASRQETLSMVAVEAMMMGKVCIVSDQTGIAEYIEHGKNGFVFHSENVEELNELMLWCYRHQECLKEIGENARKTYEHNFTMEIFAHNLRETLQL